MNTVIFFSAIGLIMLVYLLFRLRSRLLLSRAKPSSLSGHARLSKKIAKLVPNYEFGEAQFFKTDAPP